MYQPNEIEDFYSTWRSLYQENDRRGESCETFALGDQWDGSITQERSLRGEESFVFNLSQNHLMRVKGEAEKLELSLKINVNDQVDPQLVKEGKTVLNKLVLCNSHLRSFQKVLNHVYDFGYGVMQVTTKQCKNGEPSEEPFLRVINDPKLAFFDPECDSDFKTEGRFCGLRYVLRAKDLYPSKQSENGRRISEKECDVIDFWYREPSESTWYFTDNGKWTSEKTAKFLAKKQVTSYSVKFMRVVDGKVHEGPIDYYSTTKLPLIYWKGLEGHLKYCENRRTKTLPFIYNLVDAQAFANYVGSSIVSRLKKMGGSKVIVTDSMIDGKEQFWQDFNRRTGVIQVNESDEGLMQQPMILPSEVLDGTLLNALQMVMQLLDTLSGTTPAMQGAEGAATNAGLHRQIMQGNLLQNVILSNHLEAVNEVGKILSEMIPNVIIEQRDIGDGIQVNTQGKMHTPSAPQIINDIRKLFSSVGFEITYGASSDAEKAANLVAIKEILSTNPQIAQYFADEFAANLNTANSDVLKRRMEALMPPGIQAVGDGTMSLEEYQQMQQQQQQQAQQQPTIEQQQLDLQKQKISGDQQIKQEELKIKQAKLQEQSAKDAKNLQIKEVTAIDKLKRKSA